MPGKKRKRRTDSLKAVKVQDMEAKNAEPKGGRETKNVLYNPYVTVDYIERK